LGARKQVKQVKQGKAGKGIAGYINIIKEKDYIKINKS
jgi:hypothetical protein